MKTVARNVRVVTQDQAARVADLPEEISLALADIAVVAREGLLAMSVAAGMAVMQTMFDAEITAVAGPKGKHNPDREAVRHGTGPRGTTERKVPARSDRCGQYGCSGRSAGRDRCLALVPPGISRMNMSAVIQLVTCRNSR